MEVLIFRALDVLDRSEPVNDNIGKSWGC